MDNIEIIIKRKGEYKLEKYKNMECDKFYYTDMFNILKELEKTTVLVKFNINRYSNVNDILKFSKTSVFIFRNDIWDLLYTKNIKNNGELN